MKQQLKEQFSKMLKFSNNAAEIAADISLDKLASDIPYQYSLLYPLGQIGELAAHMTRNKDIEEVYPNIEWSKWRGFRNRIFHDYDMIDFSIVLEMISEALPLLRAELNTIIVDCQIE
ncbi:MAG: DUF86 domain-containing protein [Oscillospiraceae bacterium]|nr:DUF86 domain-containing protein [Oscillospiraceae bacterium]